MEAMQQLQEFDDNDCGSSVSSVEPNEDQDLSSQNNSQKTIESQISQELDRSTNTKDPNEIIQAEDLQMMIQNYKQIGGELRFNLKILESKWQSLNKALNEKKHECEMLAQQKEFQMKNLVDLQIRLENLDMERVKLLKDCQKDKSEMTELFTNEMQTLLENDDSIRNTYNKFCEIVNLEKQEFDNLLKNSKTVVEYHAKSGEEYFKEIKEIKCSFQRKFDPLYKEESYLIEEIHQAMGKCRLIKEKEIKLQQQILLTEKEIKNNNEKHDNLQTLFERSKKLVNENNDSYKMLDYEFGEKLLLLNNEIDKIKNYDEVINLELKEKYANLSQENLSQVHLKQSYEEFIVQLSNAEEHFQSIKQELYLLNEENLSAVAQLEDAIKDENVLQADASKLPFVVNVLNDLKNKESEVQELITSLKTKITTTEDIYSSFHKTEEFLKEEQEQLIKHARNGQEKLNESEKEFLNLSEVSRQHCENAGLQLSEKYREFEILKSDIEELLLKENESDNLVKDLEKKIEDSKSENKALVNLKEDLNEEINQINLMEEEIGCLNLKYEEFSLSKTNIENELSTLTMYLEEGPDVKSLEAEINQISFEMNEATLNQNEQKDSMEMSYQSQKKNWENKISREIKEIERHTAKIEARTRKMSDTVPRRNQELNNLEADLKKSFTLLIKEMQIGLNMLEEMSNFYAKSLKGPKRKELKAHLLRNLTSIDEQLARPMKCIMSLEGIPRINLDHPTPDGYKMVLNAFKEKYFVMFQKSDNSAPLEMAIKLREIGNCMFGKKWVEPTYSEILNDTEISSSTTDIYY